MSLLRLHRPLRVSRSGRAHGTAGFTMMEMMVAVALIAVVSSVVLVSLRRPAARGEAAALAQNLDGLVRALSAHRADVGRYPRTLRQLSMPAPGDTFDLCNVRIPPALRAEWRGPYLGRMVTEQGIVSGISRIQNELRRVPPSGGIAILFLDVHEVDLPVAELLKRQFDGTHISNLEGAVRYNEGMRLLSFAVPVSGC